MTGTIAYNCVKHSCVICQEILEIRFVTRSSLVATRLARKIWQRNRHTFYYSVYRSHIRKKKKVTDRGSPHLRSLNRKLTANLLTRSATTTQTPGMRVASTQLLREPAALKAQRGTGWWLCLLAQLLPVGPGPGKPDYCSAEVASPLPPPPPHTQDAQQQAPLGVLRSSFNSSSGWT